MSAISVSRVKFNVEFTRQAVNFSIILTLFFPCVSMDFDCSISVQKKIHDTVCQYSPTLTITIRLITNLYNVNDQHTISHVDINLAKLLQNE